MNIRESKISVSSPVGKSLIGKRVGECVKIKLPSNETIELEILDIKL